MYTHANSNTVRVPMKNSGARTELKVIKQVEPVGMMYLGYSDKIHDKIIL